jgi:hypothetical protein
MLPRGKRRHSPCRCSSARWTTSQTRIAKRWSKGNHGICARLSSGSPPMSWILAIMLGFAGQIASDMQQDGVRAPSHRLYSKSS